MARRSLTSSISSQAMIRQMVRKFCLALCLAALTILQVMCAYSFPSALLKNSQADASYRNYVSKATAQSNDLVQISGSNFTLRADDQKVPSATARGRDSVRITSQKSYSTHVSMYVYVPPFSPTPAAWPPPYILRYLKTRETDKRSPHSYNVDHMPKGCGTWPAIWEVGQSRILPKCGST